MPINPAHQASLTFLDESREKATMSFHMGPITALTIAAFLSQFGDLRTATQALSLGALVGDQWTGDKTVYSAAPPADINAQRERKWLVTYEDTATLAKYQVAIPCAKLTGLKQANSDYADLTAAAWVTWIAAFEALVKSPEGNGVNVLSAIHIGVNT